MITANIFSVLQNDSSLNLNKIVESSDTDLELLTASFLVRLGSKKGPLLTAAENIFAKARSVPELKKQAQFFDEGLARVRHEFSIKMETDKQFRQKAAALERSVLDPDFLNFPSQKQYDIFWSLFFPEAEGIIENKDFMARKLRGKRTVTNIIPNPSPITDPGNQIIFTSNIILTIPAIEADPDSLNMPADLTAQVKAAMKEEQLYFYDHPVQIGVKPENNEILYGLQGLDEACRWEKDHGNMAEEDVCTCILSVSVTHKRLQHTAKQYIQHEISQYGSFKNLDIYIFTEEDTEEIVKSVLLPAALDMESAEENSAVIGEKLLHVFGVDGEYGRHYSFLKAIAAFYHVFADSGKRGTFKIDLDQIFPEKELKNQTGKSAFEHFLTPLWGGKGTDFSGDTVELGMIAGALVNERDIHKGIFTPDVPFESTVPQEPEARFFYSRLLMGFSTETELMTRYREDGIDGKTQCIQRIHVTGGTNGILITHLRKYRPFTPAFIGRAEDQCYILSSLMKEGPKLAYLHEDGLIMRHDKEAFAMDAIKAASFGSTIGDYIRILFFSKYVEVLTHGEIGKIKNIIDPFTGCFVSKIPVTIVYLRYALKSLDIFRHRNNADGKEFLRQGRKRITAALQFTEGDFSELSKQLNTEREGWSYYYDILDNFEAAIGASSAKTASIQKNALSILDKCRIQR